MGMILNFAAMVQVSYSCRLYFKVKDLCGGMESLSEIGFKLLGRNSIFLFNGMIFTLCFGLLIAYSNIFSGISTSFYKHLFNKDEEESIFASSQFYIVLLAVLNLPIIFKRSIKELKIISVILFISVTIFVISLVILAF